MSRSEISPARRGWLRRLAGCARGSVVVEAAIMLPLVALTIGASLDVARYAQLTARADHMAIGLADMVARADIIRDRAVLDDETQSTDLAVYYALAEALAAPEDFEADGGVIISSVTGRGGGAPQVNWTRAHGEAANPSSARLAELAPLPSGVTFIVVEAFLDFQGVVIGNAGLLAIVGLESTVRRVALFRPRTGALSALAPA